MEQLVLGNITVDVIKKDIKNTHLSVYPPTGRVRISAPLRMELDAIRLYAISRLGWIKRHQVKLRSQEREAPREFLNKESHYFNGKRYLLKVIEHDDVPRVVLRHNSIELYVRPHTNAKKKEEVLNEWYRQQLKERIPVIIEKWEKKMHVKVGEFTVRKMKTRWGTCNSTKRMICLNLELAKKPPECLEYIVVHEMTHLIERSHGDKFVALMNKFMPKWRFHKDELNRLPIGHVEWGY